MQFSDFQFSASTNQALELAGYDAPTPIQRKAIPVLLEGKDVLGLAQTGTGKTAAFVLPMVERLLVSPAGGVRALIIAPTRELAEQILEVVKQFTKNTKLRSVAIYGGVPYGGQLRALQSGVDIVVACPGRLLDHIQQRTINLSCVGILVLDEADMLLDMGFVVPIKKIIKGLPTNRQSMLFSATMPKEVISLVNEVLENPVQVEVNSEQPVTTVSHAFYPVADSRKNDLVLKMLPTLPSGSVLIFTRTKHRAKRLSELLLKSNFSATCLQGNLSQNRRQAAITGFRSGKFQILVATDIAARGIDVSSVNHVINFDIPDTVEAYTHRIGRTGRAAREGDAFTFITTEDKWMVNSIERKMNKRIERRALEGFDAGATQASLDSDTSSGTNNSRPPRRNTQGRGGRGPSKNSVASEQSHKRRMNRDSRGGQGGQGRNSQSAGGNRRQDSRGPDSRGPNGRSQGGERRFGQSGAGAR